MFIGQLGLRVDSKSPATPRELRIAALGRALIAAGHQVTVTGASPYVSSYLTNYHGMSLHRVFSLNPQQPGGWLYLLLSLLVLWRQQPAVAHFHSWKAASMVWLAALLAPQTTMVWTLDIFPNRYRWLATIIARQANRIVDVITVPTRTLQYRVLHSFNIATQYIPDGFSFPTLKDLPLTSFGLRQGQYCLLLAQSEDAIRAGIRAYAASKTRKKLVILADPTKTWQRLINYKSFVLFVGEKQGRQLRTLVRQAAVVIASEDWPGVDTLLLAMQSGRSIIAANTSLNLETLGVTAQYYRSGKIKDMASLLRATVTTRNSQKAWGLKAKKRARLFTWENIIPEYLAAYRYRAVQYVSLDSARRLAESHVRA